MADVVEYYNSSLDHYFITWAPDEIAKLDAGTEIKGWKRTGKTFRTHSTPQPDTSPVCRFYIPPELGNSHYFGRGTTECNDTRTKNPTFFLEDSGFMHMYLPTLGACPVGTTRVFRVFSNRPDANHRYMTDKSVRAEMVAKGWLVEGDGPDSVVMCSPSQPPTKVTVYTETSNPLLMSFVPEGGKQTTWYGKKDEAGVSTAVDGLYIESDSTSQHLIATDTIGRPSNVTTADGTTMRFSWQSGSNFNVALATADGKYQANVALNGAFATSPSLDFHDVDSSVSKAGAVNGTLEVSVTESGSPATNAFVWANVTSKGTSGTGYNLPLGEIAPGTYAAGFANSPSSIPPGTVESACNQIVGTATKSCAGLIPVATYMTLGGGCVLLAAGVSIVATPAAGAFVLLSCESAFADALVACTAVRAGVPTGVQAGLCKTIESTVALYDPDGMVVTATAKKHKNTGTSVKTFPGSATLAQLSIELTCAPPMVVFNGVCREKLPLTGTFSGSYHSAYVNGGCSLAFPGTVEMTLTQVGRSFSGTATANTSTLGLGCAIGVAGSYSFQVQGTIASDNTVTINSTFPGLFTGVFRNETLTASLSSGGFSILMTVR